MKYPKDFGYMSLIQTVSDVNNAFLSRREPGFKKIQTGTKNKC